MHPSENLTTESPVYSAFADDPDFAELLDMFFEAIPEKRQILEETYRAGEVDQLRTHAHQLKGAGGGYGFQGLSKIAAELEDSCKANDVDGVGENLDKLLGYLGRICV